MFLPDVRSPPPSQQKIHKNQQVEALEDLARLLKLVTEQEKKYGDRLSTDGNFYRRHLMVLYNNFFTPN